MTKITMDEAREKLEEYIEQDGPFTHNLVSMVLRKAADDRGTRFANALIEEFHLDLVFGIQKSTIRKVSR